ncbi:MAG: division/cell wall cluster transcriptional repressor MraZ [Clostridia bacterium]
MAMYGEFTHRVDEKGRVVLPSDMREVLGDKFVIAKSTDNTLKILYLYTRASWEKIIETGAKLAAQDRSKAQYVRILSASGKDTELDSQNRVLIPIDLRTYANIGKEAVLLGAGTRVELWNTEEYKKHVSDPVELSKEKAEENASRIAEFMEDIAHN